MKISKLTCLFLTITFLFIFLCGCSMSIREDFTSVRSLDLLKEYQKLSKENFQETESTYKCPEIKLTKDEDREKKYAKFCYQIQNDPMSNPIKRCYTQEPNDQTKPYQIAYTAYKDLALYVPKNKRMTCLNKVKDDIASWWLCDPIELKKIEKNLPNNEDSKNIHQTLRDICVL